MVRTLLEVMVANLVTATGVQDKDDHAFGALSLMAQTFRNFLMLSILRVKCKVQNAWMMRFVK